MNEAIISNSGKLALKQFPRPKLQNGSVIIRQEFFGLNYDDIKAVKGRIKNPNLHNILGVEASGVVEEVSADCKKEFKVGDRVCYATYNPGAFIKFRSVSENYLVPMPKYLSTEGGATLLKGLLAYTILGKVFVISAPVFIILSGASGGVGSIITQIASKANFKIIALTSKDAKKDYIKSNGAFEVINYKTENVAERVKEITKGVGADYFFDCLGSDADAFALESLKLRGFLIQFGTITGESSKINLHTQKEKSITTTRVSIGNYITNYNDFLSASFAYMKSIQAGVIVPKITIYPFSEMNKAFSEMQNGSGVGQKVLQI